MGKVNNYIFCEEKDLFGNVADIEEMVVPDKIAITRQAVVGETIERPLPKQYKKNPGAVNKDRRNIAEATKLLGLKSRKAFKKFAKKLRVNPNILAGEKELYGKK